MPQAPDSILARCACFRAKLGDRAVECAKCGVTAKPGRFEHCDRRRSTVGQARACSRSLRKCLKWQASSTDPKYGKECKVQPQEGPACAAQVRQDVSKLKQSSPPGCLPRLNLSDGMCRKALLQSEGYQKSQLARAAIQHDVTQAAEADHAVIKEVSKP